MKPTAFFIDRANYFLETLNQIVPIEVTQDVIFKDESNKEHKAQSDSLEDMKRKVILMFQEFDKGEVFLKIVDVPYTHTTTHESTHKKLTYALALFLDHLASYRK